MLLFQVVEGNANLRGPAFTDMRTREPARAETPRRPQPVSGRALSIPESKKERIREGQNWH